jgi:hypothetical protein
LTPAPTRPSSGQRGEGGSVTLSFPLYEDIPVDAESMKILDLETQYRARKVVHGAAAYQAAEARLLPAR